MIILIIWVSIVWLFVIAIFAWDVVKLDLVLFLIFEDPVSSWLLEAVAFDETQDVHSISFDDVWIEQRLLVRLLQLRNVIGLHQPIFLDNSILVIADSALLNVVHYIIQPYIKATKWIKFLFFLHNL